MHMDTQTPDWQLNAAEKQNPIVEPCGDVGCVLRRNLRVYHRDFRPFGDSIQLHGHGAEAAEQAATPGHSGHHHRVAHESSAGGYRYWQSDGVCQDQRHRDGHRQHLRIPHQSASFDLGIDVVIHSGTKYLGGHSDLWCGVALTSRESVDLIRSLVQNIQGQPERHHLPFAVAQPQDPCPACWMPNRKCRPLGGLSQCPESSVRSAIMRAKAKLQKIVKC